MMGYTEVWAAKFPGRVNGIAKRKLLVCDGSRPAAARAQLRRFQTVCVTYLRLSRRAKMQCGL